MTKQVQITLPTEHEDVLGIYKKYGANTIVLLMYNVRKLKGFYAKWDKKLKTQFDHLSIVPGKYGTLEVTSSPGAKSFIDIDKVQKLCDKHKEDINKLYSETKYTRLYIEPVKNE